MTETTLRRSARNKRKEEAPAEVVSEEPPAKKSRAPKKEQSEANEGDAVPDVTLLNQDEEEVNVYKLSFDTPIVLFSYSRANTPGCSRQADSYGKNFDQFSSKAKVFGISADGPKAQLKFKNKYSLPFDLLCDPKFELLGPIGGENAAHKVVRSQWVIYQGKLVDVSLKISPDQSLNRSLKGLVKAKDTKEDEKEDKKEDEKEGKDEEEDKDSKDEESKEVTKNKENEDTKEEEKEEKEDKEEKE
uniref:thioredoxin-dependent peroxiredoxin n=1 Tax=Blastobotrys adeninivorans TaxID=409370 RepID=A0A060T9G0_BLAAD